MFMVKTDTEYEVFDNYCDTQRFVASLLLEHGIHEMEVSDSTGTYDLEIELTRRMM